MSGRAVEVKICGLCRPEDGAHAAAAGAAYAGVILSPGFGRSRTLSQAASIFEAAGLRRAGVFVDAAPGDLLRAAERLRLDVVQLHGSESPAAAAAVSAAGFAVWKAVRPRGAAELRDAAVAYGGAVDGLLLEGRSGRGIGGVGAALDWRAVAGARDAVGGLRVILAGGLTPGNVAGAIALLRPDIADVSSGVEDGPGRKSARLVEAFIGAVRGAAPEGMVG